MPPAELATTIAPTEQERLLQAEALVRGFCGWHIAPSRTVTAYRVWPSGQALFLKSLQVTDVTAIRDVTDPATPVTEDLDDWTWTASGVIEPVEDCDLTGRLFEVDFVHGYADVPADITAAVQAIASGDVALGVLKSKTTGPFSEAYTGQEQATAQTLNRYRIPQSR